MRFQTVIDRGIGQVVNRDAVRDLMCECATDPFSRSHGIGMGVRMVLGETVR